MLQLSQRPLTTSAADRKLFVNREEELSRLQRAVGLRFNTLLLGERGSGRSSLLRQLKRRLANGRPAFYVDATRFDEANDLLQKVVGVVSGNPALQVLEFRATSAIASGSRRSESFARISLTEQP